MDKGWNLDLKAIHLNKGAGPDTFKIATVKKDYNQLVLEPWASRESSRGARRNERQAQDQVMGPQGIVEREEAGPQREQGRGLGRGTQETVHPRESRCLVMF